MKYIITRRTFFLVLILLVSSKSFPQASDVSEHEIILSLIQQFANENPFICGEAISEVAVYGNKAVPFLLKFIDDKNDNVRYSTTIALSKIAPDGKNAIPGLINALKDKSSIVRWCSAIALGKFKKDAEAAVPQLINLLKDENRNVRWAAYVSLNQINKSAINRIPSLSSIIEKIEKLTPLLMNELKVPGVSISLIKNYTLVWTKSFGITDVLEKTGIDERSIFEACSMSKPVFTYLVLKLVEQGKLELDLPLSNYLEEEFVSAEENYSKLITARMILTHTSGMPNWRKGDEERDGPLPIYFKPGTKFSYSGEGFYYLQRVVEHITKEPLESFAKRILFDKLGFESTSFIWTEELSSRIATGHDTSGNRLSRSRYTHANAAFTLYTTPNEYAKFIVEIMNQNENDEAALSQNLTNEMLKHQISVDARDVTDRPGRALGLLSFRGLGWGIDSTITGNIVYHSGANRTGFRCYSQLNENEGSGIVIMTNSLNGSELWQKLISEIGDL